MATLLQLALDGLDRKTTLEMGRQLVDLVDALELGPQLLRVEGPAFVRAVREAIPDRPVACWAETQAETEALIEVGVEGLTVPASLADDELTAIIARGRKAGRRILMDLVDISDPVPHKARLRKLEPDLLKIPVGVALREWLSKLREVDFSLAFSGTWGVAQVPWLLQYRPVALIAGTVVTAAPEPRRTIEAIRARMAIAPAMSRFY